MYINEASVVKEPEIDVKVFCKYMGVFLKLTLNLA